MSKRLFLIFISLIILTPPAWADPLKVVGTYPYIQDLVQKVGGKHVQASSLAKGNWDPHFIVPKPSLLVRLRRADVLVINGAQLEIGWLPPLLNQANNSKVQPGQSGFLDLSGYASLIQKPQNVSRAQGDVHPQGNPHFILDPDNLPKLTDAIAQHLCRLAQNNCATFKANNASLKQKWTQHRQVWRKKMQPLKGKKVLEYHRLHDYFLLHYGLELINTLEPLPGIPPSPQYLAKLLTQSKQEKAAFNIRGVYNPEEPSKLLSQRSGIPLTTLPHDVNALPNTGDIFQLFDTLVNTMTQNKP